MEPFEITDHEGARLTVRECGQDEHGYLGIAPLPGRPGVTASACVEPLEIDALAAALYRACGKEPPVMLGRPDLGGRERFESGGIRAERLRTGEVLFFIGACSAVLAPSAVRAFAAASVALADLPGRPADGVNGRFAASLRRLRRERQLSPAQLAKAAGISKDTVLKVERGANGVTLQVAGAVAAALGTTVGAMTDAGARRD
jgi:DNA-binding XRE family transcriptional regulator